MAELEIDNKHHDTGCLVHGGTIADRQRLQELVKAASHVCAGIRTQSWDVALTKDGPVLLEANFENDLNLTHIAMGRLIIGEDYAAHLGEYSYTHASLANFPTTSD